ncbi:hypothetical protein [Alkalihalobacillus sp. CinArs1]|uniref:hypothetical protein n=1 Tax=Alkalihalobacillus sp. CinArs1 TaxID=2995314 RepID=UPI0022DE84C5|nr:hypothetical protein [Alkalihalobacillus sp. CinArs1]
MKHLVRKAIYLMMTLCIFLIEWRVVGWLWNKYIPFHYKTDLIGLLFVLPVMVGSSFLLASLAMKVLRE